MAYEEIIVQFNEDTVIGAKAYPAVYIYLNDLSEPYRTILILALEMAAQAKTLDKE